MTVRNRYSPASLVWQRPMPRKFGSSGAGHWSRRWMYRPAALGCHTSTSVLAVGVAASDAEEVGGERSGPLVAPMNVSPSRVGLPHLDQRLADRRTRRVEHATGDDDPLAHRLAAGACVAGEIGVLGRDRADRGSGTGELGEGQRHLDERVSRGATEGR